MSGDAPVFAVVGRVNKGKSSIVSTLIEDDSVLVAPEPGTTTESRAYPVRLDGQTLFTLVDTPGFQRAPEALAWLEARGAAAAERPEAVRAFVAAHEGTPRFQDECRLLAPVLAGAGVLYVVDGTNPYRPNYDAEMEILRWTGRPRMALVNRIGSEDFSASWRPALAQYFSFVRDFDAWSVTFEERLALLRAFRELDPTWRVSVDRAVAALWAQRRLRRAEAATVITALLVGALTLTLEVTVRDAAALEAERGRLEASFHDRLRALEADARRAVERIYAHHALTWHSAELERPLLRADLFAAEVWRVLGLSPGQLVAAGAISGAVLGGGVDALAGGASLFTGTALGAAAGGGAALWSVGRRFARARPAASGLGALVRSARRYWSGGRAFRIGPHRGRAFPWVLLDRALVHYRSVAGVTHARRGAVELHAGHPGIVAGLDAAVRARLDRLWRKLAREGASASRRARDELAERVLAAITTLDAGSP